jgi:hypothetical protein
LRRDLGGTHALDWKQNAHEKKNEEKDKKTKEKEIKERFHPLSPPIIICTTTLFTINTTMSTIIFLSSLWNPFPFVQ